MRRALALLAVLMALSAPAAAKTQSASRHCMVANGWNVVAKDAQAVVTSTTSARAIGRAANPGADPQITEQWRYCLRKTGRFHDLVANEIYAGGYGDLITVGQLALAGAHVAYERTTTTNGGRDYGTTTGVIYVRDLQTGRSANDASDALGRLVGTCWNVKKLLLAPAGTAAWEVEDYCSALPAPQYPAAFIQALDDRTGKTITLDTGGPGSIANLALFQCIRGCAPVGATFAWWTRDGSWRATRIG